MNAASTPGAAESLGSGVQPPPTSSLPASYTVLLAEDDDFLRSLVRHVLEQAGHRVLEAHDCQQALQLAREHDGAIHLLLTDVVMPQMSGATLAARLAESRPEMCVLYMSGYPPETVARYGVDQARMAFVQKPFSGVMLTDRIAALLQAGKPAACTEDAVVAQTRP